MEDRAPEGAGTAGSSKLPVGERLDADEPVAKSSGPVDPADGPAVPDGAHEQVADHDRDTVETNGSRTDDVSHTQYPATEVIPAYGASNAQTASEAAPVKRKRRTKTVAPVVAAPKAPDAVVAASDDEIHLDDEIRALRGQLVDKLRLQNAQLKKMLERFER